MPREDTSRKPGKDPWYAKGLRFGCTRCGRCCTGAPGYVWMNKNEIHDVARFLKITDDEFLKHYCRRVMFKISLLEHPNGDCVFFTPAGCRIYNVRPEQCTTFPFWDYNIESPASWENAKTRCPGTGQGRLYSLPEIERIRAGKRTT